MAMRSLETDYLVVGAGAMGMAFTDALIDHADVHVTLVDRRHAAGGHWQDAYPFVQLHQASLFYGVASTALGGGNVQMSGPEAGLQERARRSEIQAYYDDILYRRFLAEQPGFLSRGERVSRGRLVPSRDVTGFGRDRAGRRAAPRGGRRVPVADDPRDDARRRSVLPLTCPSSRSTSSRVGRSAEQVRDCRFRQDRHRRDSVVVDERRRARSHRLGAPT